MLLNAVKRYKIISIALPYSYRGNIKTMKELIYNPFTPPIKYKIPSIAFNQFHSAHDNAFFSRNSFWIFTKITDRLYVKAHHMNHIYKYQKDLSSLPELYVSCWVAVNTHTHTTIHMHMHVLHARMSITQHQCSATISTSIYIYRLSQSRIRFPSKYE